MRPRWAFGVVLAGLVGALAACGDNGPDAPVAPIESAVSAEPCLVRLHGRSETGRDSAMLDATVAEVSPTGNGRAGGGHQWLYDTDQRYAEARDIVAASIDAVGCTRVVLNGFSNGASFAAKLHCRGESFDDRVVGVVIDDPVTDTAVQDCSANPGVKVALYWTGALAVDPGTTCADKGWTCDGEVLLSIEAYTRALETTVQRSPFDEHVWYRDAPEMLAWLNPATPPATTPPTAD